MVDRKGPIQGPTKKPQNTAMEVIAEEMIDGIFCHYEPPDDNSRYKSILRKPRSRRAHRDASIAGSASVRRRVRWSDEPKSNKEGSVDTSDNNPFEMRCLGSNCADAAVEAGIVSPSSKHGMDNYDYDLRQTFSEDSGVKPRESRAHHHVMFDDNGNPVPTKPGVKAVPPPPRPPPKKKEMFIPELCGVRIGYEDDDDDAYDDDDESSRYYKKKKKPASPSPSGYQRPDHSKYRPSYEYREEDENSLLTEERANQMRHQQELERQLRLQQEQREAPPPPPPPPMQKTPNLQGQSAESQPPAPRPSSDLSASGQGSNNRMVQTGNNGNNLSATKNLDIVEDYRGNLETADEDWGSQYSTNAIDHPAAPTTSTALVPVANSTLSGINFCGNAQVDCKDDWDESVPVIPCIPSKKKNKLTTQQEDVNEPPKLDAPDSRDSQEENKPEKALRYTPNMDEIEESEVGTELAWHSPEAASTVSKRRSFFKRGRNRDKRQSLPGRVEVLDDAVASPASKTTPKSFLNFRSRSKSPGRKRIFGRNRSSDVNSELGEETASQILEDLEKQSFIGAYRDSMDASEIISGLHPAHPLKQPGNRRMSNDEKMERQSFITAHRESMDSGEPKVQTITERLRRIRAQKAMNRGSAGSDTGSSGPVDLDDDFDDEMFERQSMITAHRESFERPGERKALVKVRRIRSKKKNEEEDHIDANDQSGIIVLPTSRLKTPPKPMKQDLNVPEHLKHLARKDLVDETAENETPEEEKELTWEERTKQAWERIRSGLGLSTEEDGEEKKEEVSDEDAKAKEQPVDNPTLPLTLPTPQEKKATTGSADDDEEQDSKETLVEETPSTLETLANIFSSASMISTDSNTKPSTPLKSILKSPSSEKRVTFGEDQERIFHDDHDENDSVYLVSTPTGRAKKKTSILGKLVKKASPSPKKKPGQVTNPPRNNRSPLQPSPIPQQRSQSPSQQRSPSPMQPPLPYMYPPYPQQYPHMMPAQSPINGYPMIPSAVSGDSSAQQPPTPQYFHSMHQQQQMPVAPVVSTDSSQNSQQQSLQSPAQQPQFMPPYPQQAYMAPPYFYGYPPNYGGGYMYPPGMMPPPMVGGAFPEEHKKKKKRVFRGRKLLSGVLSKGGRNSLGGVGTMETSSLSMEDGYSYGDEDYDESVYSVAETQA